MIHYSCDRCKRLISSEDGIRYVVRIEIQVAVESDDPDSDDDRDHLMELKEILEELGEEECAEISEHAYQVRNFDLCCDCHRAYIKNPIAMEPAAQFGFSDN